MPAKPGIRRLVLDVLKPIKEPSIIEMAMALTEVPGVEGVNITVKEVDVETLTLVIVIEGSSIDFEELKRVIEELGSVIHSIDQVVAGHKLVELPVAEEEK